MKKVKITLELTFDTPLHELGITDELSPEQVTKGLAEIGHDLEQFYTEPGATVKVKAEIVDGELN